MQAPEERHAVERNLDFAEALGCGRGPVEFDLTTTPQDEHAVELLVEPLMDEPFAVLMPGTNWATKRWPAERFAMLAHRLASECGLRVVVAGADDAREAAEQIDGLNLVGRTRIRQLVSLLRRASLVVSNDSGPMHLAAALGRPLVAPFGPTSAVRTGPFGRQTGVVRLDIVCSPCFKRNCVHQTCMASLTPDVIFERCIAAMEQERSVVSSVTQHALVSA
ncbi:MAG: glycosyltransferase family 9 protein [Planctomycetota bacterium]